MEYEGEENRRNCEGKVERKWVKEEKLNREEKYLVLGVAQ